MSSISTNSAGQLQGQAYGNCETPSGQVLAGEIKQDLSFRPDPVVTSGSDPGPYTFVVALQSCDAGPRTSTYYVRGFFNGHTDYADSGHRTLTVC
ncbi:hypothetical protein B0I33_102505 [Prauserella shujinwangii]|uniref:Uncharacterized protein n=1 Tax=Prauserella shujinwangii TaxID=1453103 RepID=A0A2T0M1A9_9PSEU|nr:hypothetical protein B0I33_102505 [Prauserella shujinwangii]